MTPHVPKKPRPPQHSYYSDDARGVTDHILLSRSQEPGFAAAKPRLARGRTSKRPGRAD